MPEKCEQTAQACDTGIGSSGKGDLDLLRRLCLHEFRMIARAAAIRLARLAGDPGIRLLQSAVTVAIEHQHAQAFGLAVRDAQIDSFGLLDFAEGSAIRTAVTV